MLLSIVIPIYNESDAFREFYTQLIEVLTSLQCDVEIIVIDDGSKDGTDKILREIADHDVRMRLFFLSRNFGHQAALTAGLDQASGDVILTMDGDGQHPPSLIPRMLDLHKLGYDIVLAQQTINQTYSPFKRWTSSGFYWLINRIGDTKIQPGVADYRLMSRQAVNALKGMREYHRFLRGMVSWIGYETVVIPYTISERLGGKSKYSVRKMFKLAMDAIFSFSQIPIQIGVITGGLFLFLALVEMIYVLSFWFTGRSDTLARGWSSLMFIVLIGNGTVMILLGLIGLFIAYIFQEVKRRPIYLFKDAPHHDNNVEDNIED